MIQIVLGTVTPLILLFLTQVVKLPELVRKRMYVTAGCLALIGIFAMRWNVVIGGQLFSKSFLGLHDLQDGTGDAGRIVAGGCFDDFAVRVPVGAGEAAAAVG